MKILAFMIAAALAALAAAAAAYASRQWVGWSALVLVALIMTLIGLTTKGPVETQRNREELAIEPTGTQGTNGHIDLGKAIDIFAEGLETAVFICNEKGEISYANRRAMEFFNFREPAGRSMLEVTLSYDLQNFIRETFTKHEKHKTELAFTYPLERLGLCEAWLNEETQAFVSIQDVTELRRLERIRKDFVANVSHELRTPLATIRAMAETMADERDELATYADRFLPKMIAEVDRLSLISADLLSLSSAESNPVRKHACDIAGLYKSAVNQLQPKALSKKLSLNYKGPETFQIEANSAQMSQVAINLIDNAINYTNFGAVAAIVETSEHGVTIRVQDTGIGIAREHLDRIFERFYRADKARSRATGGTGLGLSIVKHIVEVHGGSVAVESESNEGSTFTIVLPIGDITKHEPNAVD